MTNFEWFLLIVVVIGVPLIIAVVVTIWTIDQARKRNKKNRDDVQVGVKRKAALTPEEVEARRAERAAKQAEEPPPDESAAPDVSRETTDAATLEGSDR